VTRDIKKLKINLDAVTARYYRVVTCRYNLSHILQVTSTAWHFAIHVCNMSGRAYTVDVD